ncbi:hypothetical protein GT348_06890 [Aristophania vespae]|uniref:TVP38/TMEM64 family membrane protein n=1 Tax=Aristophania vespae TaxID=2697033 RepID=A0A6P1NCF6_9PROT|nr:VTT domain-containing protein [Aristophania vespae]QHI95996.1 hypothetical protein GT348_06890 [Aristophania vespae]
MIFIALALILLPLILWQIPVVQAFLSDVSQWQTKPWGWFWFSLIGTFYCAFGLSRQALCFAAGLSFGFEKGLLLCTFAYEAGSCLSYLWARFLSRSFSSTKDKALRILREMGQTSPFLAVLSLRLLPIGSALLVSIGAGLVKIPFVEFVFATLIGGIPQNVIFTLIGTGTHLGHFYEIIIASLLFLLSSLVGLVAMNHFYKARLAGNKSSGHNEL